jgi:hypothetical protein
LAVEGDSATDELGGLLIDPGLDLTEQGLNLFVQRGPGVDTEYRWDIGAIDSRGCLGRPGSIDPGQR